MATSNTSKNKQALGKGIRALLNNIDDELNANSSGVPAVSGAATTGLRVPIEQITPNPMQPRRDFDDEALRELADSIKMHDIIQPVTVTKLANGKYQLIS
ncbi:MAG: ParB N-terminal domain-containing protein, partial [Chitinophagaceae bacterium]